jgi:starvation-inducible DNA-binding protein
MEQVCQESLENLNQLLARTMARLAAQGGDDGTNDLIVSDVPRRNELQVWFVAEHVVEVPLTPAV